MIPIRLLPLLTMPQKQGMIRFKGLTNHSRDIAREGIASGIFDTVQFPLSMISLPEDWEIAHECQQRDIGVIAMKAMSGGLITNARAAFAYMRQYDYVVPIWGIQYMAELEEFLGYEENEPVIDAELKELINKDRAELAGNFCRGCGYCLPCPANIDIPWAARAGYILKRMPVEPLLTPQWQAKMAQVSECIDCGACKSRCPYGLDTPNLLKTNAN